MGFLMFSRYGLFHGYSMGIPWFSQDFSPETRPMPLTGPLFGRLTEHTLKRCMQLTSKQKRDKNRTQTERKSFYFFKNMQKSNGQDLILF